MHHPWTIGLILTSIAFVPGCTLPPAENTDRTDRLILGQEQCTENNKTGCPGPSRSKIVTDKKPTIPERPVEPAFLMNQQSLDTSSQPFISHSGGGKYASYLVQNIPFQPIAKLRKNIELRYGLRLKHRGEAHITVVTPPEFERLSSHLNIETINAMVSESIQKLPYQIECLGLGGATITDTKMFTFFIVVKSRQLTALRDQIATAYIQAGGPAPAFKTEYWPHITIGFTHRDLHDSDGVNKSTKTCISEIVTGTSTGKESTFSQ